MTQSPLGLQFLQPGLSQQNISPLRGQPGLVKLNDPQLAALLALNNQNSPLNPGFGTKLSDVRPGQKPQSGSGKPFIAAGVKPGATGAQPAGSGARPATAAGARGVDPGARLRPSSPLPIVQESMPADRQTRGGPGQPAKTWFNPTGATGPGGAPVPSSRLGDQVGSFNRSLIPDGKGGFTGTFEQRLPNSGLRVGTVDESTASKYAISWTDHMNGNKTNYNGFMTRGADGQWDNFTGHQLDANGNRTGQPFTWRADQLIPPSARHSDSQQRLLGDSNGAKPPSAATGDVSRRGTEGAAKPGEVIRRGTVRTDTPSPSDKPPADKPAGEKPPTETPPVERRTEVPPTGGDERRADATGAATETQPTVAPDDDQRLASTDPPANESTVDREAPSQAT